MLKSNQFYNPTSFDTKGIQYPSDTGTAQTTIHCNRTSSQRQRDYVLETTIPAHARGVHNFLTSSRFTEKRQAQKALNAAKRIRHFHAYLLSDGTWAIDAKLDLDTCQVITCDHVTTKAPTLSSNLKRYGTYKTYGVVFHSAEVVRRYAA